MNFNVLRAVFKRNFLSYFASPTGYVFICVFVLLSTIAAFWNNEFFNRNLANLDQLTSIFPLIMLIFVPAITMSIWADERRQGTDELLLTIPADDLAIVLGKYLAAVAIYSVALVFSLVCNLVMLAWLSQGNLDVGLFLATYIGYWFVGLAMLAVGMVASFLTGNVTVAYVLGAVFNVPLAFDLLADMVLPARSAVAVKEWLIGERLSDFSRGVISFSSVAYFLLIAAVMLYLSMVLIGRRHWWGGRDGKSMLGHYLLRALALLAVAAGLFVFASKHDVRPDISAEQLSSLSPKTKEILKNLKLDRPVLVDAFISERVPESYVETKANLETMLRELQSRGRGKIQVTIHATEQFSEQAQLAEQRYGIRPREVASLDRGRLAVENLFMGVAFRSGLEKVVIPFLDRGIPVEYELVRSIATVAQEKRKRVGIVRTDAPVFGRFDMGSMSPGSDWPIIEELKKQYEVEEVDPAQPIASGFDALLVVQPSSLGPAEMENFVKAVESGVPTAIFEDPLPVFAAQVPGTTAPRRSPGMNNPMMMMGGGQQEQPKGDIAQLWNLLGVDFTGDQVVWQDYNPYRKASQFPEEFVFVDRGAAAGERASSRSDEDAKTGGGRELFNRSAPVSAGLQQILFPFPGAISEAGGSSLTFTPLVKTSEKTGIVANDDLLQMSPFGPRGLNPNPPRLPTGMRYIMAAQIRGKLPPKKDMAEGDAPAAAQPADGAKDAEKTKPVKQPPAKPREINVVVVADIDMLTGEFFRLREQGNIPEAGIHFNFDNVTFVLNTLDTLAGDDRFIAIRSRRPQHRTLSLIDAMTEETREQATKSIKAYRDKHEQGVEKAQQDFDKKIAELRNRQNVNATQVVMEVAMAQEAGQRRLDATRKRLEQERDAEIYKQETRLNVAIEQVQDRIKLLAAVLPPIPPLLIGIVVFFLRRSREREGVAASRLR